MCKKLKLTQEEAEAKVARDKVIKLNNNKMSRRPQVHSYHCRNCKAWHTTTIHNPCFK